MRLTSSATHWSARVGLALAFALATLAAGCGCAEPSVAATDADPGRGDVLLSPEPCSSGIRRATIDVPLVEVADLVGRVLVGGHADEALVAQIDVTDARVGRLTVAGIDGARRLVAESVLPDRDNAFTPAAFSTSGPDRAVLYVRQGDPFAAIATFVDGERTIAAAPAGGAEVTEVAAAAGAARGFVAVVTGSAGWSVVSITPEALAFEPLGVAPWTPGRALYLPQPYFALTEADARGVVLGAFFRADHTLVALRLDTSVEPPTIEMRDVAVLDVVTFADVQVSRTDRGPVVSVALQGDAPAVRLFWLDDALDLVAEADLPPARFAVSPIGVVGGVPERVAFLAALPGAGEGLFVASSPTPGELVGGARPLVTDLVDVDAQAWQSLPGSISIVYWRGTAEVLTLCAP